MSFENPTVNKEPKGWRERIRDDAKEKVIKEIKASEAFDENLKKQMIKTAQEIFADREFLKQLETEGKWEEKLQDLSTDAEEIEKNLTDQTAEKVMEKIHETL